MYVSNYKYRALTLLICVIVADCSCIVIPMDQLVHGGARCQSRWALAVPNSIIPKLSSSWRDQEIQIVRKGLLWQKGAVILLPLVLGIRLKFEFGGIKKYEIFNLGGGQSFFLSCFKMIRGNGSTPPIDRSISLVYRTTYGIIFYFFVVHNIQINHQ